MYLDGSVNRISVWNSEEERFSSLFFLRKLMHFGAKFCGGYCAYEKVFIPLQSQNRRKATRKDAGVVDRDGLENRCTLTGTQGSNPCLSANTASRKPTLTRRSFLWQMITLRCRQRVSISVLEVLAVLETSITYTMTRPVQRVDRQRYREC